MTLLHLGIGQSFLDAMNRLVTIMSTDESRAEGGYVFIGDNGWYYNSIGFIDQLTPPHSGAICPGPLIREQHDETLSQAALVESWRVWGNQTFGEAKPIDIIERAEKELNEAKLSLTGDDTWNTKTVEEIADIVLVLTRAPGLWEAMVDKMEVNKLRRWGLTGKGTGFHIP